MSINYNLTGEERKALVAAISEILEQPAVYQYTPSYAYMMGDCTIDKNGVVSMPNSDALAQLKATLAERGYTAAEEGSETTVRTLTENSNTNNAPANDAPKSETIQATNENGRLTIRVPLNGFTPEKLDNLKKLVESKATLIKKALGVETLPIAVEDDKLHFPWFTLTGLYSETDAYARFVATLCKMAKEQKRVTAKDKDADNEKFAMRIFLIRLGFIGPEFKTARKVLLCNLTGNSSWKSGQRPERVVAEEAVEEAAETAAPDNAGHTEKVGEL